MTKAAIATLFLLSKAGFAELNPGPNDVYIRVVDTGPGLCTITRIPGVHKPHFLMYDSRHWVGTQCLDAVRELIADNDIDLFVREPAATPRH
jgi:hypothetical protein